MSIQFCSLQAIQEIYALDSRGLNKPKLLQASACCTCVHVRDVALNVTAVSAAVIKLKDLTAGGKSQAEVKWNNTLNPLQFKEGKAASCISWLELHGVM